jgi:hypothetical protein
MLADQYASHSPTFLSYVRSQHLGMLLDIHSRSYFESVIHDEVSPTKANPVLVFLVDTV